VASAPFDVRLAVFAQRIDVQRDRLGDQLLYLKDGPPSVRAVLDPASIYIDRPDMIGVVVGVPGAERLDETPQPVTAESGRPLL
jgi:hypothetical protein